VIDIFPWDNTLNKEASHRLINHMLLNGQVSIFVEGFGELWRSSFIPFPEDGAGNPPGVRLKQTFDILSSDHVLFKAAISERAPGDDPMKLVVDIRATGVLHLQHPVELTLQPAELRLLHSALTHLQEQCDSNDRVGVLQSRLRAVAAGRSSTTKDIADAHGRQLAHELYQLAVESGPDHLDQLIAILQQLKGQTS
jgi:hypothetical protein